jgi:ribosomal protein L13E
LTGDHAVQIRFARGFQQANLAAAGVEKPVHDHAAWVIFHEHFEDALQLLFARPERSALGLQLDTRRRGTTRIARR